MLLERCEHLNSGPENLPKSGLHHPKSLCLNGRGENFLKCEGICYFFLSNFLLKNVILFWIINVMHAVYGNMGNGENYNNQS